MFDSHMHSSISYDSEMDAKEAIHSLKRLGLGGVFTEHYDLGYPEPDKFLFDSDDYFRKYSSFRESGLLLGIELGMVSGFAAEAEAITEKFPYDHVIGSIHVVEGKDIYYPEFYEGRSKLETYGAYFQAMQACILEYKTFDTLGHIDYISRYAPYDNPEIWCEEELKVAVDRVLRLLIETGRALEFNTRRIQSQKDIHSILPVFQRYHDLGGSYVTVGSDAHTTELVGWKCSEAAGILIELGLVPIVYKKRNPVIL